MLDNTPPSDVAGLRVSCFNPFGDQFATHWALKSQIHMYSCLLRLHPTDTDKHKIDLHTGVFIVEFTAGNGKRLDMT